METVSFSSIKDEEVKLFVQSVDNANVILKTLTDFGSPLDDSFVSLKRQAWRHCIELIDSLLRVEKYGWFLAENCLEMTLHFFT